MLRRVHCVLTVRLTLRVIAAVCVWSSAADGLSAVRLLLISVVRLVRLLRLAVSGIIALSRSLRLTVLLLISLHGSLRLTVLLLISLHGSLRLTVLLLISLHGSLRLSVLLLIALRRHLRLIVSGIVILYGLLRIILLIGLSVDRRLRVLLRSLRLIAVGRLSVRILILRIIKAVPGQCVLYGRFDDRDLVVVIRRLSVCLGLTVYRSVFILGIIVFFWEKLIHNCLFLRFITCGCFYIFTVLFGFILIRCLSLLGARQAEGKAGILVDSGVDEDIAFVQTHYGLGYEQT